MKKISDELQNKNREEKEFLEKAKTSAFTEEIEKILVETFQNRVDKLTDIEDKRSEQSAQTRALVKLLAFTLSRLKEKSVEDIIKSLDFIQKGYREIFK